MEEFLKYKNVDDDVISILKENDVDMEVFRTMTEQDLKDVGITSFGKRRKLYMIIISLLNQNEESPPASTPPFTHHASMMSSPQHIAQNWIRSPTYSILPKEGTPSTSPTMISYEIPSTYSEQIEQQQACKRLRLDMSEYDELTFDLVSGMKHYVEGRKYLCVKDDGVSPTNRQRKVIVNVAVASLIEQRGLYPTAADKTLLAEEIIRVFPSTKDMTPGMKGYEHFFKTGAGFIEYRLKNLRLCCRPPGWKQLMKKEKPLKIEPIPIPDDIPTMVPVYPEIKVEDQIKEKVNWMKCFPPTTENEQRHRKLFRETFEYRGQLIGHGHNPTSVINEFPRFKDMPELINLEFEMFNKDNAANFTSRWSSHFTQRILTHGKRENQAVIELIASYENGDSDLCALLVVFKLLHGNSSIRRGHMRSEEVANPLNFLIQHAPEGTDVDAFACSKENIFTQPFILAVGPRQCPNQYYVILDHTAIEAGQMAVSGFDICFKAHHIFKLDYSSWTQKFWQFIALHVYGIQMPTTAIVRSLGTAINNTCVPSELEELKH